MFGLHTVHTNRLVFCRLLFCCETPLCSQALSPHMASHSSWVCRASQVHLPSPVSACAGADKCAEPRLFVVSFSRLSIGSRCCARYCAARAPSHRSRRLAPRPRAQRPAPTAPHHAACRKGRWQHAERPNLLFVCRRPALQARSPLHYPHDINGRHRTSLSVKTACCSVP